jgi:hypothetical protein
MIRAFHYELTVVVRDQSVKCDFATVNGPTGAMLLSLLDARRANSMVAYNADCLSHVLTPIGYVPVSSVHDSLRWSVIDTSGAEAPNAPAAKIGFIQLLRLPDITVIQ